MSIEWTERAVNDLESLLEYIAQDDLPTAQRVGGDSFDAVSRLERFPGSGKPGRVKGTRELFLVPRGLPYVVVYEAGVQSVCILRVLHSAREWPSA